MLCMSSAGIPGNVFTEEAPISRSAIAKGTIHLTHSSSSTLFRAAGRRELTGRATTARNKVPLRSSATCDCSYPRHFPRAPETRSGTRLKRRGYRWKTQGTEHQACTGPAARKKKDTNMFRMTSRQARLSVPHLVVSVFILYE